MAEVPDTITLVPLPPDGPELNPVERLWLFLEETDLSLRILNDQNAIVDACCNAWNQATPNPERVVSLCHYPWIKQVSS